MRGTLIVNAKTGRMLRHQRIALLEPDVLDCTGDFRAGDKVYVVVRGEDGGQGVLATGIVRCDESALKQASGGSISTRNLAVEGADPVEDPDLVDGPDPAVVIAAPDLELLWPEAHRDHP